MFVFVFIFCLLYLRLIPKSTNIKKDYNMALILMKICFVFSLNSFFLHVLFLIMTVSMSEMRDFIHILLKERNVINDNERESVIFRYLNLKIIKH